LQASGQAAADDQTWTFTIEAVEPPEGLYRFADTIAGGAEVVGGWIVLPDGTQVGALNVDGQTQPAPALDVESGQATVSGTVVTPERLG
jgi:serine/threonine-protein kinase